MESEIEATDDESILRVKGSSNATALAAAIAHATYDNKLVVLRAIGAGAVNQAIKACAIARGYVAIRGNDLSFVPGFATVPMKEGPISAITIKVIST